jgi:hypothetical protein
MPAAAAAAALAGEIVKLRGWFCPWDTRACCVADPTPSFEAVTL